MGYIKSIGTVLIYIGFFLAVITFLPGLPPEAEYSEYSIKFPSRNENEIEILFSGEIKGPEDFASFNGEIYTGICGGYVVKIEENRIKPIVKFGQKCDGLWQEKKCGRPLGLKFNDKGELFVADAYYGIFKVNVNTRQYVNVVNSSEPIDGKITKIFNALDIAKNGDIYWTDSSTDFYLHDGIYSFLANPSGRLIRYNAATKKNEVLIKNLGFPNGVLLSDDESFVIVGSTLNLKILKYNLKGPKAGQQEIFIEGLPGLCDNIHSDGQGGFLVSLLISVDSEHPVLPLSFIPHPYIRKMISRLIYSIEGPFKLLQDIYPNYYSERVLYTIGSFEVGKYLTMKTDTMILRLDKTGKILSILYSENGDISQISSAHINDGYLWLGSPWNDNIMRIPLKQAFPDLTISTKFSAGKEQKQKEPLLTVSATPNVKVEEKPIKSTIKQDTTKPPSKSTIKAQTKQELNSDTITSKPTSQSTTTSTTTTSKPTSSLPKASTKEVKKDNLKKTEKDNPTEIQKDKFKSQIKSETLKITNEARPKTKSDDSVKKDTQSIKSKPVKENEDKTKK
ncbi:Adipocyte plasma membrane-associated protein [Melipona quadrifasciata]|uniref:Adipocyte plasma membrane-associated protein n=1 Tax=Melipona quadrifasciata TaxID=166423 RepID=A0A0M9A4F6_9HYME|nr:Adipocyte plasma membrane-associated protein [Melipona quadrifasciata]